MFNKTVLMIFLVVIFFCLFIVFFLNKTNNINNHSNNNNDVTENNQPISNLIVNLKLEHKNIYAGAYLDEQGVLNINLIKKDNYREVEKIVVKEARVHYVDFTLEELDSIINTLNNKMLELEIKRIELDEKDNRIYIYFDNDDQYKKNKVKAFINSPTIEFRVETLSIQ